MATTQVTTFDSFETTPYWTHH